MESHIWSPGLDWATPQALIKGSIEIWGIPHLARTARARYGAPVIRRRIARFRSHYSLNMTTWILLAGAAGTGKSTLAKALESRLSAVTLSKDCVRSVLFPGTLTDYTGEQDDLCMRAITGAAAYLTAHARVSFISLDGRSFSRRRQIDEVIEAAERAEAAWKILHLSCADEVAAARLSRNDPDHPARNRDFALYRRIVRDFEPIPYPKLDVDTTDGIEQHLDAICAYLVEK